MLDIIFENEKFMRKYHDWSIFFFIIADFVHWSIRQDVKSSFFFFYNTIIIRFRSGLCKLVFSARQATARKPAEKPIHKLSWTKTV